MSELCCSGTRAGKVGGPGLQLDREISGQTARLNAEACPTDPSLRALERLRLENG